VNGGEPGYVIFPSDGFEPIYGQAWGPHALEEHGVGAPCWVIVSGHTGLIGGG
jgi:hypothetical protein